MAQKVWATRKRLAPQRATSWTLAQVTQAAAPCPQTIPVPARSFPMYEGQKTALAWPPPQCPRARKTTYVAVCPVARLKWQSTHCFWLRTSLQQRCPSSTPAHSEVADEDHD